MLEKSLRFLDSDLAKDPDLREQFRAASILAFEYTHELGFRFLKRALERMVAEPAAVDQMTYMEVVCSAAEAGLIAEVARYSDYREKRNITSHTYDAAKAEQIRRDATIADLREGFDESDLPFKVDLVEWATTNEGFRRIIEQCHVAVHEARPAADGAR